MYCSELSVLSSCVESVVHSRCSQTASHLVNVLVRSSVQLSPLCTTDMLDTVSYIHTYTGELKKKSKMILGQCQIVN